ncbi:MAG: DUF3365 domain-containing protein [Candidatus Cloacimonetes bacterium]|nr:DUF3365 domain-containing protein [Candidatus Cloacimonadota bacterium]
MNTKINFNSRSSLLLSYFWYFTIAWTIIVIGFLLFGIVQIRSVQQTMIKKEAQANFNKDQALRFGSATHGGVYVPVSDETQPNPYLRHVKDRDIEISDGKILTLMNPAYMLRQTMENYEILYGVRGHITSLKYFRPETAPDEWEKSALRNFEKGTKEISEFTKIDEKSYFRYMSPMIVKKGCLKCHGHQGYQVGDIRGGVSISVPMAPYLANQNRQTIAYILSLGLLWLLGVGGLVLAGCGIKHRTRERDQAESELQKAHDELEKKVIDRTAKLATINKELYQEIKDRKQVEKEREQLIKELREALENVRTLSGLIPICAHCNKIRDDRGYWNNLEGYIQTHSDAEFSHGMCPECSEKLYGKEDWYIEMKKEKSQEE